MELKWNLHDLFENDETFENEFNIVEGMLSLLLKNKEKMDIMTLLDKKWEIKEKANNILVYGSLKYYQNINSEHCVSMKKRAEVLNQKVNDETLFIDQIILKIGKTEMIKLLDSQDNYKKYKLIIENLFRKESHVQSENINKIISGNLCKINDLINEYNSLINGMEYSPIVVDGEETTLITSNFAKFICSRDRDTRKQAYHSINNAFNLKTQEFAKVLNEIYSLRNKNAELENYETVLDKVLFDENIDSKIVDSLIKAINNNLNLAHEYLQLKVKILGIEDAHLYDTSVPLDNNVKHKYTIDEAVEIIKKALLPLGDEYLKIVDELLDGHIDALEDENKHQSIIFSWHTYSFMNFRGSYGDLKNLIHELGHIVNYYLSKKNQPFMYEDSTIFVGETSSLINEILLNKYLMENASTDEEKMFFLSKEIENYFTTVFKQVMYTEFENILYNKKKNDNLSSEYLSLEYAKITKKYFGENLIYDDCGRVEWTRLGHLYRWSYYPYKYATGLLIASTCVNNILNGKITIKEYLNFLAAGSNDYSLELLKKLKIDFNDLSIIENGLCIMKDDIKKLSLLVKK